MDTSQYKIEFEIEELTIMSDMYGIIDTIDARKLTMSDLDEYDSRHNNIDDIDNSDNSDDSDGKTLTIDLSWDTVYTESLIKEIVDSATDIKHVIIRELFLFDTPYHLFDKFKLHSFDDINGNYFGKYLRVLHVNKQITVNFACLVERLPYLKKVVVANVAYLSLDMYSFLKRKKIQVQIFNSDIEYYCLKHNIERISVDYEMGNEPSDVLDILKPKTVIKLSEYKNFKS